MQMIHYKLSYMMLDFFEVATIVMIFTKILLEKGLDLWEYLEKVRNRK